jgi:hypothetical protein
LKQQANMDQRPPADDFGKRRPAKTPPGPPVKRSGHVALLLMGTLAVGSGAYALMPRPNCEPVSPGMAGPALPDERCHPSGSSGGSAGSGSGGGGHGGSSYFSSSGDSSGRSASTGTSESGSGGVTRGGFGSFGHGFGGSGGE